MFTEYLESDRFPAEQASLALRDYLASKYRGRQIDAVLAVSDTSLRFVLRHRDDLFPNVPIVYYGSAEVDDQVRRSGAGLTGMLVGGGVRETLALALRLHADTERTFVVAHPPQVALPEPARTELQGIAQEGRISYIAQDSIPGLIAAVKAVPPHSIILYVRQSREEPGRILFASDVARQVAAAAPVPVYGVSDQYIGSGVVGGAVFATRAVGVRLGEMVRQVLEGTRPQDMPIEHATVVPTFDWRQMRRWGVMESDLPAGSRILFRNPGAWELYRPQIVVAALIVLLQTAFIAALLVQRSRRVHAQKALSESEERFRLLADTAPVFVWTAGVDTKYDFFNRGRLEFTGRPLERELGHGWTESVLADDRVHCVRTYLAAFEARQPFHLEYRLRRADGAYRWILDIGVPRYGPDGAFAGYIGSGIDITDRKEAVDALRENQQRYAVATAAGGVGVWDWNFETSEIYVDPTLKAILGFTDAEISTRADDWGARIHPLDLPMVTAQVQACMDGTVEEYEVEHRMLHKDGSVRWFLSRGSLVRRADGTPHRMIGTKVDITARKKAEEVIRENQAVLEATNSEMQDLAGRLIASQEVERARIARDLHDDLSQQIAGLSIALSALKRRIAAVPEAAALHPDVASLQKRTVGLAENIRHVSHDLHPSVIEHVGLVEALGAHCAELQRRHPLTIAFSADGDFASIKGDAALCLYRVAQEGLRNVVTHAKASQVHVLLHNNNKVTELTISDDGRGFEMSRGKQTQQGLGLVSINERVRLSGGSVSMLTEVNKVTRLRVAVPLSCQPPTAAASQT